MILTGSFKVHLILIDYSIAYSATQSIKSSEYIIFNSMFEIYVIGVEFMSCLFFIIFTY